MIVIAIIGIIAGFAAPRVFNAFGVSIDETERKLTAVFQLARSNALTQHRNYIIQFDIDEGKCGFFPVPDKSGEEPELEKPYKFPEGITLKAVKIPNQPRMDKGKAEIKVTYQGIVENGLIYFETGKDKTYTFQVKPFSGKFKVFDRYIEVADGKE
jgi:type II secretory pathway pseudopilin PulG